MTQLTSYSAKLGRTHAAHLLRRATFGADRTTIEVFAHKTPAEALDQLLQTSIQLKPPVDLKTGKPWLPKRTHANSPESILRAFVIRSWLHRMCNNSANLAERMVYFYHTHFTTIQSRANYASALYYQHQLFCHYALGNFKSLTTKICYDQAMLMHLDGRYNRKENPNENFAREFLELYSIGKGPQIGPDDYTNYTEEDIKQATRVFSGFQIDEHFAEHIDQETGIPMGVLPKHPSGEPTLHDFGKKVFSEKFGRKTIAAKNKTQEAVLEEITELVDMVFAQPETARHICRKLYRFFVYAQITPEVEREVIEPLSQTLLSNQYEMRPVLKELLCSRHFYDVHIAREERRIVGTMIKSPLEILAGTLQYFQVALPQPHQPEKFYELYKVLLWRMQEQGLDLYEPPDVAGYPAYHQAPDYQRNWISASSLAHRYKIIEHLIRGVRSFDKQHVMQLDVMAYVNNSSNIKDGGDAEEIVRTLLEDLYPRAVSEERFAYFLHDVLLDSLSLKAWRMEWEQYKTSGKDAAIRRQLETLITKIIQSPEYQLY